MAWRTYLLRTPWHGGPICCAPHGMGDLFAAQFVCVGFHSFPGEGARAVMMGCYEKSPQITQIDTNFKKIKKNLSNLCNLWTIFFHCFLKKTRVKVKVETSILTRVCHVNGGFKRPVQFTTAFTQPLC